MAILEKKYYTVNDRETVNLLLRELDQSELVALDTETTSLNPRQGVIIGFSISTTEGSGYYFPSFIWNSEREELEELSIEGKSAKEISAKILTRLKGKKLVCHNASFDLRYIKNYYGVDLVEDLWADTGLLVHTVQEEGAGIGVFGLKAIAISIQEHIGLNVEQAANQEQIELKESIRRNKGQVSKDNFEIYKADLDIISKYAAADTDLTLRIYNYYSKILEKENLVQFFYEEEVMPLYKEVTIPMEELGVALDMELVAKTKQEIEKDLEENKKVVLDSLLELKAVQEWIVDTALKEFPPSNKGLWAQALCERHSLPLPRSENTKKYSITKKTLEALEPSAVKDFLVEGDIELLDGKEVVKLSMALWKRSNDGDYINIQSKKQLGEIAFNYMGIKPLSQTDKGQAQFDMDMVEQLAKTHPWAENLRIYNKLLKIKSTYVDRFYEEAENGRWYPYFKQHGTVSGRYGSDAQQLPKPKEDGEDAPIIVKYNNLVRAFLIAGQGRKIIDADYTSLEPHCFASVSGDIKLQEIFNKGWDFYSTVAIQTEKLEGVSPDTKAPNFLKKVNPVKRNQAKAYALGIAYGMEAYALGKTLEISTKEAENLVDGYLNGFPQLKEWRENSRKFVKQNGYITNKVGRIRHLPEVKNLHKMYGDQLLDWKFRKELEGQYGKDAVMKMYRDYRNGLNGCLNYQLQSLAAAVVNRAAVQINRKAKELGIDAQVQAQVHDQLIVNIREDQAEMFAPIVQELMEHTTQLEGVTLKAPPEISNNWRDGH